MQPQPRRYWVVPEVVRSAQTGPRNVDVCRPGTQRWIRLGVREAALLFGLSGSTVDELTATFRDRFSPGQLVTALDRFDALGLLTDAALEGREPSPVQEVRPASLPPGAVVLPAVLVACATASIPLLTARTPVSLQWLIQARPSVMVTIGLILFSALVHEAGHAVAAQAVGRGRVRPRFQLAWLAMVPVLRVHLSGFWGLTRTERSLVTCAGCISQIVLAAASIDTWTIWLAVAEVGPPILVWYAVVSLVLAVVNALPLYPLDGYWLLGQILDRPWLWRESRPYRIASSIGMACLAVIAAGGLIMRVLGAQ